MNQNVNVYAPPAAEVGDAPRAGAGAEFYVVSGTKFLVLFFMTLGMYQLYWFYQHWAHYRRYHAAKMWPVARAVFSIFFTHALTREIDASLARSELRHQWSPALLATGFVIFSILNTVCDRLSAQDIGSPYTDVIGLSCLLPLAGFLLPIQRAANLACQQPQGESNQAFTWANWLWIALGAMLWLLVLVGLAEIVGLSLF